MDDERSPFLPSFTARGPPEQAQAFPPPYPGHGTRSKSNSEIAAPRGEEKETPIGEGSPGHSAQVAAGGDEGEKSREAGQRKVGSRSPPWLRTPLVVLHSKMNQLRAEARVAQTELTQDEISASVQARPQPVDAHNLVWVRHDQVSGRFNQAAELYNRTMALDEKRRGKEIGRALRDLHGYLLAERQQLTEFGHLRKGEREMGGRSTIRCSAGAARTQRLEHELVTERGENTRLVEAAEADRASFATERAFITSERKKIRDATEGHQAASRAWQSYCETRLRIMHEECKEQRKEILALRERVYLLRTPGDAASQASQSTSRSASTSTSTSTSTNTSTNTNTSTSTSTSTSKSTA